MKVDVIKVAAAQASLGEVLSMHRADDVDVIVAVCDRGLVIRIDDAPPVTRTWAEIVYPGRGPDGDVHIGRFIYTGVNGDRIEVRISPLSDAQTLIEALREQKEVPTSVPRPLLPPVRVSAPTDGAARRSPASRRWLLAAALAAVVVTALVVIRPFGGESDSAAPTSVSTADELCENPGVPVAGAAPYSGSGPHRLQVFEAIDEDSWSRMGWFPTAWSAGASVSDLQLVACARRERIGTSSIRRCEYKTPTSSQLGGWIDFYPTRVTVDLYEAATGTHRGQEVRELRTVPACPANYRFFGDDRAVEQLVEVTEQIGTSMLEPYVMAAIG